MQSYPLPLSFFILQFFCKFFFLGWKVGISYATTRSSKLVNRHTHERVKDMRHFSIKQATEGETSYYQVTVKFDGKKEVAAKRHIEEMLSLLNWVFKGEDWTYSVELAEIPFEKRLACSDQNFKQISKTHKEIAAHCELIRLRAK